MKKINNIYLQSILIVLALLTACQDTDYEFGEINTPSNITVNTSIIGQDTDNPYGDGSGEVQFTVNASNAISYKLIADGIEYPSVNGDFTIYFSTEGVNTYNITVIAYGAAGVSSTMVTSVEVLANYAPPAELLEKLHGTNSKTWRIKSEKAGHFGLGPVGGQIPAEWYSAGPEEKAGVGMYDDRIIFYSDGTFEYQTGGTIFGRDGLINELGPITGNVNGADVENFQYEDYTENWFINAPGGIETLNLTNLGFIGYYVGGSHSYQIFDRSVANELLLKITDGNNEFDWWFIITSEAEEGPSYTYNNLVWEDTFSVDGTPDSSKWTYDLGTGSNGWGNGESQYYTDRADNVKVENGNLIITAKREDYQGSQYTSARLKTQGLYNFQYGRVEIRAQLPQSAGTWPALWMLGANFPTVGWPYCGEIDIMEQRGDDKNSVLATTHWYDDTNMQNASYNLTTSISNSGDFHLYTIEWTETYINIYLDDVLYYEFANNNNLPFNQDFFLIFNIAMGGTLGGTIDSGFTEDSMVIDYVKVYQ